MKVIEYVVLDHEEHGYVRRIQPFAGYGLPDGPEREAEKKAIAMLGRRNDPIPPHWFAEAMDALAALRDRLEVESDANHLNEMWGGDEHTMVHATLIANNRRHQFAATRDAEALLRAGWLARHDALVDVDG